MHIAVIGLGVLGASAARALARNGATVTVFEQTAPGTGTTATSFGWVNSHDKHPRAYHELNAAGMAEHKRLHESGGDWFSPSGVVEWAADAAGLRRLHESTETLRERDYSVRWINAERTAELLPDVRLPAEVAEFAWYPDEGYALPLPLLARLWGEAREHGARLRCPARVTEIEHTDHGVLLHTAEAAPERFDFVVTATGRWSQALAGTPMADWQDPASTGYLAYTSRTLARLPRLFISPELNARPEGGGRLVIQALDLDEYAAPDQHLSSDGMVANTMLERLRSLIDGTEHAEIERVDVGIRSYPADGHTVAGHLDERRYALATHSGITLAPLLGRLAAEEILHDKSSELLTDFRPQRFNERAEFPPLSPARFAGQQ